MTFKRSSSLNGALPTVYVQNWGSFTDLTSAQILAYQAFPQDLIAYIRIRRWHWEICATSTTGPPPFITLPASAGALAGIQLLTDQASQAKVAALKQAIDNGAVIDQGQGFPFLAVDGVHMVSAADITAIYGYLIRWVQQTYGIAAQLIAQVTSQGITTRAPIDAAFAAMMVQ
jgi:hypothetical protein